MAQKKSSKAPSQKDARLKEVQEILLDPESVAKVLPEAIIRRSSQDEKLTKALAPTISKTLSHSIKRNPKPVTEALFPIIGPAIRKAVAQALKGLVTTINRAIQHSLSLKGLAWRFEALRTGKSFAEIVLLKTLGFRVEQVFLIHKKSGLLLSEARADVASSRDPDMISAMLTAIQDFVHDSFVGVDSASLETLQVGEVNIWVEQGSQAVLACVIRGEPPMELKTIMQDALETIHLELGEKLESFEGDASPFEPCHPILMACLEFIPEEAKKKEKTPILSVVVLSCIILGLLGWWGIRRYQRWEALKQLKQAFQETPGYVLMEAKAKGSYFHLGGLKDPFATEPQRIAEAVGIEPQRLSFHFQPYIALDHAIVLKRAKKYLKPPPTVKMAMQNEHLILKGVAPYHWIKDLENRNFNFPGIQGVDLTGLKTSEDITWKNLKEKIEGISIFFPVGKGIAKGKELHKMDTIVSSIKKMQNLKKEEKGKLRLTVFGHTTPPGDEKINRRLRYERSKWIAEELKRRISPSLPIEIVQGDPTSALAKEVHHASATLRVTWVPEDQK